MKNTLPGYTHRIKAKKFFLKSSKTARKEEGTVREVESTVRQNVSSRTRFNTRIVEDVRKRSFDFSKRDVLGDSWSTLKGSEVYHR